MTKFLIVFFFLFSSSFSQNHKIDVNFYDLNLDIDPDNKYIKGSNNIFFNVLEKVDTLKINLFQNFIVDSVLFLNTKTDFEHIENDVLVFFNDSLEFGNYNIEVFYKGKPIVAKNPPWDGGFVWKEDSFKNHWVGVACQGDGASIWWPCHDVLYDKPDSISFSATVPRNLKVVSNGNLFFSKDTIINGFDRKLFVWKNSYPINNYNLSVNIADYKHFSDSLLGVSGILDIDYYVLKENYNIAVEHFSQVKPMIKFFEKKFGSYPFYSDGYALVETPYLGMEHQTCIAYGNQYKKGYLGNYPSNIDFDFIIIHETAHEWWGNNITMGNINDMWIHEAFATYAEALYVEEMYGYDDMLVYLNYQKKKIKNKHPIKSEIFSSTDMYYKGSWMLHTLRSIFRSDKLWNNCIKDLQFDFKSKIVDTNDIIDYIGNYLGHDLTSFFNQYLFEFELPILEYYFSKKRKKKFVNYRWKAIDGFNMPILVKINSEKYEWIYPKKNWQKVELINSIHSSFNVAENLFLVDVKKIK